MQRSDLPAPFPWFGGKRKVAAEVWSRFGAVRNYVEWISHRQFAGCLPQRFVALFVDHRRAFRAFVKAAMAFAREAGRWIARCAAFVVSARLPMVSLSAFSSSWWTPMRGGILPCACSHTTLARSSHVFGSAVLMNARRSPPLPCRVLTRTVPTGNREFCPYPSSLFMDWKETIP